VIRRGPRTVCEACELRREFEGSLTSEQKYRQLFERANDLVFTLDLQGNFTSVNNAVERISGYVREDVLAMNLAALAAPECRDLIGERIQRAVGGETISDFELPISTKDGRRVFLEIGARLSFQNGVPVGMQGIARDITERKRLEEHLRHTQKMEAIGELAAGLAHDFNNLLSAILGYTDLLKIKARPGDLAWEAAEVIETAGERAQELTDRLLGFARRGRSQNLPLDPHQVLREVIALLKRTLPKSISIRESFAAPDGSGTAASLVVGDPGQIHQVFLNLALNARDAMPGGGVLTFQTEAVTLDEQSCGLLAVSSPGSYLRVSVSDTGAGIPYEHQARVFEPFFTTKDNKKGTGMGLAMVYGIVKNHGGAVELVSQPGHGATFNIYLPLRAELAAPQAGKAADPIPKGSGRILVIDDEEVVCRTAVRMLEALGYQAIPVPDPREAIECYRKADGAFDLVVLDMIMPGMSGRECFYALREINSGIKAILTSGYAQEGVAQEALDAGMLGLLRKPYKLPQLAGAVARALAGDRPQPTAPPRKPPGKAQASPKTPSRRS